MKKIITILLICLVSLIITFVFFEAMSWYHFGDIPTRVVLWRLIIFYIILTIILVGVIFFVKSLKKK